MSGWRPALRIARRSARRHLGRSVLVAALVAVPVAGLTVGDGLVRTTTDRDVDLDRVMGTADVRVNITEREAFDVGPLLPDGSRVVPISTRYYENSLRLAQGERIVRTRIDVVVLGDPLTRHLARVASGRLPEGPGEVLLTAPLAEELGVLDDDGDVRPGTRITAVGGPTAHVTGVAVEPYCLVCEGVVASPGSVLEEAMFGGSPHPVGYLVDLPDGVDAAALARSWPTGRSTILTRESYQDTTPVSDYLSDATGEPAAILAGLGLLGVVVTAAAAFSLGARRQVRELGLVAANGGTARHLRRVVLAQGLTLGVVGAVSGLVLGAAVTVLGTPLWERLTGQLVEDLRFGWLELTVAGLLGVLASVLAALVPALGAARLHPVDALAGRFRAGPPRARFTATGVFLVVAGLAAVLATGQLGRAYPDRSLLVAGTLAGIAAAVAGLLLVGPAVLAAVGRLGARLPLSARLAVRDAVRHRHRTVAAAAAVMITVTASVAAAFVLTARLGTVPGRTLPENAVLATLDPVSRYRVPEEGRRQLDKAITDMAAAVPGAVAHEVTFVSGYRDDLTAPVSAEPAGWATARNCSYGHLGIGRPDLVELSAGRPPDARVRSALARGEVVVFDECLIRPDGTVRMTANLPAPVELPARYVPPARTGPLADYLPTMFVSPERAAELGWRSYGESAVVTYPDGASEADVEALLTAAEDAGVDARVEENEQDTTAGLLLALAGVTAVVALLGAGVAVTLSAADGRADLATLAALGAQPWRRRTLAGAQALVISALGTLAGLVVGACVGFTAVPVAGIPVFSVPWPYLGLTAVVVPLLATAVAAVATPSRLPLPARRPS